ncbi:bifunctional UDP-N-acetylmuramoyl-tripeptide:D-alanyl-D-alanine ligase/alanine racemase [Carboxylicivirga mesophila]|uniref:Alanine racemase n=2 Tax=Carboxylicivirga mesophila TaxID=1166478 RepID=A0ABS5K9X9_9BACT|nr:bifunctional UDP-N-acetylmuramoyl-tripeptide:D-alanyl-D-alanine ligase/alanine racemase [Carboxylicivirga mesophila]
MFHSLTQLAKWSSAKVTGNTDLMIQKIAYDSRKTFVADQTLFVAIKSANNDGHAYIPELYEKGMRAFLVDEQVQVNYSLYPDAGFIICKNTVQALQAIAASVRQSLAIPFIGITGSNGKTIVKEWLARLLESHFKVGRSPRSFNSQLGVPLSIWMLEQDIEFALIEAGISQPGEMRALADCIHADFGIFTNIGRAHQENFASMDEKLEEKLKLFESAHTIFFHGDDVLIGEALLRLYPEKKLLSCGKGDGNALQLLQHDLGSEGAVLQLNWKGQPFTLHFPYQDVIAIDNLLLVVLVALELGLPVQNIINEVPKLQTIAMRLEQKEGINNCLLIDDGYNADLTALELGLDFLNQMGAKRGLSKTLILSDIYQSGMDHQELYAQIQKLASEKGVEKLIGIGEHLYVAMDGANAYRTTADFLAKVDVNNFKNEAILLKGSRQFAFEQISALLEQRRHKTVLEINLNALSHNIQYFRSKLKKETRMLAMVKAFSYGTGSFEIANLLQHQKVDFLGVAFADEGIELRKAGITLPIIVMNPELSSFPMMLEYELEPEIYSFQVLDAFLSAVQRQGLTNVPVHIKIDTGMNRLGFVPTEISQLIERLKSCHELMVSSVFSHLAGSDEAMHDGFTRKQIDRFKQACETMHNGLGHGFIRHLLNSAGIERFADAQFDMVRLGIGMYGVSAIHDEALQQVNTLKSYVSQVKEVEAGATIGYSRKGQAESTKRIAVIPIGYADGYNRRLSNGVGQVLINGHRAPVIGNICMDMCMADVTQIHVQESDEVEIFGAGISISEVAEKLGTIPYEILTSISRRVKRVYVME